MLHVSHDLVGKRETTARASSPEVRHQLFTFAECEQMSDLGLFVDQHVELLEGRLTMKGLQPENHAYVIQHLSDVLHNGPGQPCAFCTQLVLTFSAPPPDWVEPNATTDDALLVVAVSDSTLERDQTLKLWAYTRNGIREY